MGDSKPPYLPHHVITEILSWLPPETLVCFTTVCKLWSSTIVNPKFMQLHRSHFGYSHPNAMTDRIVTLMGVIPGPSTPTLKLRVFPDSNPRNFPCTYELIDNNRGNCDWYITGICNGLFCCIAFFGRKSSPLVVLCNPTIRRTIPIPCFQFHPGDFHYGVGFDAVKNDYKVVRISRDPPYPRGKSAVFSLNSNVWKTLDAEVSIPHGYCFMGFPRSIFLNGFLHWVILPTVKNLNNCILCFDVHNEVFGTMQMPSKLSTKYIPWTVVDFSMMKGLLSIMVTEFESNNEFYEVWTMNEYGIAESWTKLFRVQLPGGHYLNSGLTVSGKIMLGQDMRYKVKEGNLVFVSEDEAPRHMSWTLYDPETLERSNLYRRNLYRTMQTDYYSPFAVEASLELLDYATGSLDKYRSILL